MSEEKQPPQLTGRFTRAFDYARTLHASDVRKGTAIPYLSHTMAVASIVLEHGGDEDQAIAALLHDAGEDHGGELRLAAIEAEFGTTVANIVRACSDDLPSHGAVKRNWWDRKVEYLDHLQHVDRRVALVSAADKLHNARAILTDHREPHGDLWARFNKDAGRSGSLWYYRSLASTFEELLATTAPELVRELRATVDAIVDSVCKHEKVDKTTLLAEVAAARDASSIDRRAPDLAGLTSPEAVREAIAEFDHFGRTAFLDKYGFGPAREYWLVHDGRRYDSKAVAPGAAFGRQFPDEGPLRPDELTGGSSHGAAASVLSSLGFTIVRDADTSEG